MYVTRADLKLSLLEKAKLRRRSSKLYLKQLCQVVRWVDRSQQQ